MDSAAIRQEAENMDVFLLHVLSLLRADKEAAVGDHLFPAAALPQWIRDWGRTACASLHGSSPER